EGDFTLVPKRMACRPREEGQGEPGHEQQQSHFNEPPMRGGPGQSQAPGDSVRRPAANEIERTRVVFFGRCSHATASATILGLGCLSFATRRASKTHGNCSFSGRFTVYRRRTARQNPVPRRRAFTPKAFRCPNPGCAESVRQSSPGDLRR